MPAWNRPIPPLPPVITKGGEPIQPATRMGRPTARAAKALTQWEAQATRRGQLEERWCRLLSKYPTASPLAAQVAAGDKAALVDCLSRKSVSTLASRLSSLEKLEFHCHVHQVQTLPLDEEIVYSYLKGLRSSGAAPSSAKALREAMAFAHFVLGVQGAESCLSSGRCTGVAWQMEQRMRERRQRPPLSVAQVRTLQSIVSSEGFALEDRIFAGYWCFTLACRARDADAQRISDEPFLDIPDGATEGFIEAACVYHKTAHLRRRQRRLLPVVGFAFALDGSCWARHWLRLRREQGLHVRRQQCLMPAPQFGGGWSIRRLTSDESQQWVRRLLTESGHAEAAVSPLGTHSAKATLLSWCAKYGTPIGTRRLLGGHAKLGDSSALEYGRDNLAGPMRELIKVLKAVARGSFRPDATRSGMLVPEASVPVMTSNDLPDELAMADDPSAGEVGQESAEETQGRRSGSSSSSKDDSSSCSSPRSPSTRSSSEEVRVEEEPDALPQEKPSAWRHVMRQTIHRAAEAAFATACGRTPTAGVDPAEGPISGWPFEALSKVPERGAFCLACFPNAAQDQDSNPLW